MAFENISKGEKLILLKRKYPTVFEIHKNEINQAKNLILSLQDESLAEFITFAFNLQQRYDISKLEETVELLERLLEQNMCSVSGDELIEQLLKEIKK